MGCESKTRSEVKERERGKGERSEREERRASGALIEGKPNRETEMEGGSEPANQVLVISGRNPAPSLPFN